MKPLAESRILLVNASEYQGKRVYREYPLGLGYIATVLSQAGARVRVLDQALDGTPVCEVLRGFNPTLVGFSFLSTSWPAARAEMTELRRDFGGQVMAGGIHASLFAEDVLRAGADVVLRGESEGNAVQLACALENGRVGLETVPGATFFKDGRLCRNPDAEAVEHLDTLPMIDRDLYDLSLYHHHSIMTSRGCPYRCKFCCNWGGVRRCRSRAPARVVEEMQHLVDAYGARLIYFADDLFFFGNAQRQEFCDLLEASHLDVQWVVQLRVDSVDAGLLASMKRSGCIQVCFGVEAGDQAILDATGKRTTVEDIRQAITAAHRVGLRTKTWWILGLPGAFEQQLASLDLMLELMPNEISIHPLVPLPGSEYWTHPERYGIHIADRADLTTFSYHSLPAGVQMDYLSEQELTSLFDLFTDRLRRAGYLTTDEAGVEADLLLSTPFQERGFTV